MPILYVWMQLLFHNARMGKGNGLPHRSEDWFAMTDGVSADAAIRPPQRGALDRPRADRSRQRKRHPPNFEKEL